MDPASRATDPAPRRRVIVERVWPEIDGGRFPVKRTVGERVIVSADIFADGHDVLAGVVKYRRAPTAPPSAAPALRRPGAVAQQDRIIPIQRGSQRFDTVDVHQR